MVVLTGIHMAEKHAVDTGHLPRPTMATVTVPLQQQQSTLIAMVTPMITVIHTITGTLTITDILMAQITATLMLVHMATTR